MPYSNINIGPFPLGDAIQIRVPVEWPNGDRVDLTGASARWRLYEDDMTVDREDPLMEKTSGANEITFPADEDGVLIVHIDTGDTDHLTHGMYHHRTFVTDADGNGVTVNKGDFELDP